MKDEQLARTMREIIDMASRTMFKEAGCTNEAVNLAKAYADARESKEIAELKADNKRWCSDFYKIKFELETAEAEIKRLRGALMWLKVNRTPDRAMIEVFIDKALSPAPVTDASKWISVNKSLPERGQAVLVCMKSGAITIAYLKLNIQVWQVFGDLNASFDPFDEIHHWMPLPLQPEPREN